MDPNIILALGKRRGFFFPSFEIYGGMAGMYDFGPLGSAMKNNIEALWRNNYVLKEGFASGKSLLVGQNPVTGKITTVIRGNNLVRPRHIPIQ